MTQFGSAPRTTGPLWKKLQGQKAHATESKIAEQKQLRVTSVAPVSQSRALTIVETKIKPKGVRAVEPLDLIGKVRPAVINSFAPTMRLANPHDLLIEDAYQRNLSGKSRRLITKIVSGWDWMKFKPPICAETTDGLFVIDGQHTAIAAATHPGIEKIPVMVVTAKLLANRAEAFVAHNRDRVAMSPLQVFHAECAAGDKGALSILRIAIAAGCEIPRFVPQKGEAKSGQAAAITALQRVYASQGEAALRRILAVSRASKVVPISSTVVYGLDYIFKGGVFAAAAAKSDDELAVALALVDNLERAAQALGSETGQNRYRACAILITRAAGLPFEAGSS